MKTEEYGKENDSISVLIDSLYRQVIYTRGVPFSLTVPIEPKTLPKDDCL